MVLPRRLPDAPQNAPPYAFFYGAANHPKNPAGLQEVRERRIWCCYDAYVTLPKRPSGKKVVKVLTKLFLKPDLMTPAAVRGDRRKVDDEMRTIKTEPPQNKRTPTHSPALIRETSGSRASADTASVTAPAPPVDRPKYAPVKIELKSEVKASEWGSLLEQLWCAGYHNCIYLLVPYKTRAGMDAFLKGEGVPLRKIHDIVFLSDADYVSDRVLWKVQYMADVYEDQYEFINRMRKVFGLLPIENPTKRSSQR